MNRRRRPPAPHHPTRLEQAGGWGVLLLPVALLAALIARKLK